MALMRQHRWIWRAVFCKAGTLESMFAMRTRIWLSVYHRTVCASRESINACTDCETARSPRNSELRELSKSDQFWRRIISTNWTSAGWIGRIWVYNFRWFALHGPQRQTVDGSKIIFPKVYFIYAFRGWRDKKIPICDRVNNSKGISGHNPSYVHGAVPKRKIFLPHTLASFRTWKRESFDPKRNNKSSVRDW